MEHGHFLYVHHDRREAVDVLGQPPGRTQTNTRQHAPQHATTHGHARFSRHTLRRVQRRTHARGMRAHHAKRMAHRRRIDPVAAAVHAPVPLRHAAAAPVVTRVGVARHDHRRDRRVEHVPRGALERVECAAARRRDLPAQPTRATPQGTRSPVLTGHSRGTHEVLTRCSLVVEHRNKNVGPCVQARACVQMCVLARVCARARGACMCPHQVDQWALARRHLPARAGATAAAAPSALARRTRPWPTHRSREPRASRGRRRSPGGRTRAPAPRPRPRPVRYHRCISQLRSAPVPAPLSLALRLVSTLCMPCLLAWAHD